MTLGGKARKALLERQIEWRLREYGKPYSDKETLAIQLGLFNECWHKIANEIPFYRDLRIRYNIPESVSDWEEFLELFPVIRKQDLQQNMAAMSNTKKKPDFLRITSGTTSRPIQMPAWNSEMVYTRPDRWMARTRYGIQPEDRGFLIWGHSGTLEPGIKGYINRLKTGFLDKAAGDYRLSAYDISEGKMRQGAQRLLKHRPDYICAYSMAMDAFARANMHLGKEFRSLNIKAVIGSSERFPNPDSTGLIEELFDCPIAMEYGALETALMAHSHPNGTYSVFWRNYFLEACEEGSSGAHILRVTSLYERCFPLIRYEIGDEIELLEEGPKHGLREFKEMRGRTNSYVLLKDGTKIHMTAIEHCVRDIKGVLAYQMIQERDRLTLNLMFDGDLPQRDEELILARLGRVHPELAGVRIEVVSALKQTAGGKTPVIIKDVEPGA
jgi:phenylacetate-CoA ligase